jgi:hypothetical protein
MSTVVFRNAYAWVNGVDLSSHVAEIALNYSAEMLDETAMGDTTRIRKGGLKVWSIAPKFHQDFAAGGPYQTLFSLVGTTSCIEVRADNSCTTTINPSFSGIAVLEGFPPFGGGVGSLLDVACTFNSASALTISTTAT